ncbi:MAG: tetratricopeptide repeat protein [Gammaproteobacteria bacterium]|nr:tetratricopeptide repeat protein [Gammaproteobacteria bacterium]
MSLINQVLKDLEQRQIEAGGDSAAILKNVRYVAPARPRNPGRKGIISAVLITLVVVAVLLVGYSWWRQRSMVTTASLPSTTVLPAAGAQGGATPTSPAVTASTSLAAPTTVVAVADQAKPVITTGSVTAPPPAQRVIAAPEEVSPATDAPEVNNDADLTADAEPAPSTPVNKQPIVLSADEQTAQTYQQAYDWIAQQRLRDAEDLLRTALAKDEQQIRLRELLTGLYIKSGRWIEAETVLARGTQVSPHYLPFFKLRARALLQLNRDSQAIAVLKEHAPAIEVDPDHYALLAALYQRQHQHTEAVSLYTRLLALRPKAGVWWVGLGISLEALQENAKAQAAYQQARASGNLSADIAHYTDNRLRTLQDLGLGSN